MMSVEWRARAGSDAVVVVETRIPSQLWAPMRVLRAEEAERLADELRRAAQEARRRAMTVPVET